MNEKLKHPVPTSFMITLDGESKRIHTNENFDLKVSQDISHEIGIESLRVIATSEKYLTLEIRYGGPQFSMPNWGMTRKSFDSDERVFQLSLSQSAIHETNNQKYIIGSNLYFNKEETILHGENWTIEYKPL